MRSNTKKDGCKNLILNMKISTLIYASVKMSYSIIQFGTDRHF